MEILIKEATVNDIGEIIKLKREIWDKLENKDWYVISGTDSNCLRGELENNGIILKALDCGKIIGFIIMCNSLAKENEIVKKLHLENEVNMCIELCNGAVDAEYRGNNLYTEMAKKAEEIIINRYEKKYILATVHPDNLASLKSLVKIGYKVICKTKMYGNLDRCILIKRLNLEKLGKKDNKNEGYINEKVF